MTKKRLISMPDDVDAELRNAIPEGQVSQFITEQVRRGLRERAHHSLDDAVADIVAHDKPLLDRLGNVQ